MNTEDLPLYNSRIIDSFIKLIKIKYSFINIGDLLEYAGMKPYEVADQGHWFSQRQIDLFYEKLVHLTGNENIAREAGRHASSPDAIGVMRQYVLGMAGPAFAYDMIEKTASNFTKSSTYHSKRLSPTKYEIIVKQNHFAEEKAFQCENRIGFLESMVMVFNHTIPDIKHTECIFKGESCCRYIVSWKTSLSGRWKRLRNFTLLGAIGSLPLISLLYFVSPASFFTSLFTIATICLLNSLISEALEKSQIRKTLENLKGSTEQLLDQINSNYNNALLTNEIGQAISKKMDLEDILASVMRILENRLEFDRGIILLVDKSKKRLEFKCAFGYSNDDISILRQTNFNLTNPESKGVFLVSLREKRPFLINNIDEIQGNLSKRSLHFIQKIGTKSFICCPIIGENESIGVLAVDNVKTKQPLVHSDVSLLMGIANVIGISIRNAELIEAKVQQFQSLLQALAATTDARDFLTAGHSEKVTEYSVGICKELNLSQEFCEVVRVAALLHDYGKVAIPDSILKKQGKLSDAEYEIVKTHSEKTREILSRINFEGHFREIPEIASSHHEKLDGTGYPRGLKGKEIPVGAKIIAVADFFEAITSKRHYRDPMQLEDAFKLLREKIGTHFEKKFVEAFISFYKKTYSAPGARDLVSRSQEKRVPFRTQVSLKTGGKTIFGTTVDLSSRGVYITSDANIQPDTLLEILFTLPEDPFNQIIALGRIAWVNDERRKKPALPTGFGVEFLEIKAAHSEAIQNYIIHQGHQYNTDQSPQLPLDISSLN